MNVLTVTGRLTADPARRDTARGVVCEFRLAVDGQRAHVAAGRVLGSARRHLLPASRAGRRVAVSGPLRVDDYVSRAGDRQRRWYLKAEHATFLDDKPATDTTAQRCTATAVTSARAGPACARHRSLRRTVLARGCRHVVDRCGTVSVIAGGRHLRPSIIARRPMALDRRPATVAVPTVS